jgi:hypothetical protein
MAIALFFEKAWITHDWSADELLWEVSGNVILGGGLTVQLSVGPMDEHVISDGPAIIDAQIFLYLVTCLFIYSHLRTFFMKAVSKTNGKWVVVSF